MKPILFCLMLFIGFAKLSAQDSTKPFKQAPVIAEVMFGNDRMNYQTVINKRFPMNTRFVFFSVANVTSDYANDVTKNDYVSSAVFGYEVVPNFFASLGASITSALGFRPILGVHYMYTKPSFLFLLSPGVHLTETYNVEVLNQTEIKPALTKKTRMYSRIQTYYSHNTKGDLHARSYINGRLGITKSIFSFGVGANWDWYGPGKRYMENYGVFCRFSL